MIRSLCTALALVLLLAACGGCAYNPKVTVYGPTGTPYIAPDLCAALLACKKVETAGGCRYNATLMTRTDGTTTEEYSCKVAK